MPVNAIIVQSSRNMPTFDDLWMFVGIVELMHITDVYYSLLVEVHLAESLQ